MLEDTKLKCPLQRVSHDPTLLQPLSLSYAKFWCKYISPYLNPWRLTPSSFQLQGQVLTYRGKGIVDLSDEGTQSEPFIHYTIILSFLRSAICWWLPAGDSSRPGLTKDPHIRIILR